ncbi:hypothetical protein ACFLQV_03670 [Calditrichota bacterium]
MDFLINFASGPLFRLCFTLMVLGLIRIAVLTIVGMIEALNRNEDRILPWGDLAGKTISWLLPISHLFRKRPFYSGVSFLFHIGLILVPLFLKAHVQTWKSAVGFSWFNMPQSLADSLTLLVILTALLIFLMRILYKPSRSISRKQDYAWPLLLMVPFSTGYFCVNVDLSAGTYEWMMLIHLLSANLIMVMIPFTKIAHCMLIPFSQFVSGIGWKFPKGAGQKVIETLGLKGQPTWIDNPRLDNGRAIQIEKETTLQ